MPTTFRVITEPSGPGKGYWFYVRIYDTAEEMREAAHKHHSWYGRKWWEDCYGCCQSNLYHEKYVDGEWEAVRARNKLAGVIRLCRPFTYEQAAHELLHGALSIYRTAVSEDANFGDECSSKEEDLAYITGQLFDQFMAWLITQ